MNKLTSYAEAAMARNSLNEFKAAKQQLQQHPEQATAAGYSVQMQYLNTKISELEQQIADFNKDHGSEI